MNGLGLSRGEPQSETFRSSTILPTYLSALPPVSFKRIFGSHTSLTRLFTLRTHNEAPHLRRSQDQGFTVACTPNVGPNVLYHTPKFSFEVFNHIFPSQQQLPPRNYVEGDKDFH